MSHTTETISPNYDFITNPALVKKSPLAFPGGGSLVGRIALVLGGIIIVLIIFMVAKSLLVKPSSTTYFVAVAQDQQALIHVSSAVATQQGIHTSTLNSAVTVNTTVASAQNTLKLYLKNNSTKLSPTVLNLKVSTTTDTLLTSAASAGTYDQTYATTMQTLLNTYKSDLQRAYGQAKGPKGKALLNADYDGATLLLKQLGA